MNHVKLFESFMEDEEGQFGIPQENQLKSEKAPMTLKLDWSPATDTAEFLSHLDRMCKKFNLSIIELIPEGDAGRNPSITFANFSNTLKSKLYFLEYSRMIYMIFLAIPPIWGEISSISVNKVDSVNTHDFIELADISSCKI
jgi:hypothetical protein